MTDRLRKPVLRNRRPRYVVIGLVAAGLSMLFSGCATWPAPTRSMTENYQGAAGQCAVFFASLDERVVKENAVDGGYARVRHFPYLRADRFIASFAGEIDDGQAFGAWIDRMQALDRRARAAEIANLSDAAVASLQTSGGRQALLQRVARCGDRLRKHDLASADSRRRLSENVQVPDDYIRSRRALGLYPITRWFVSRGVDRWHREARGQFSPAPPQDWVSRQYVPAGTGAPAAAAQIIGQAGRDGLGIPIFSKTQRRALFQSHAPVWQIQYQSENDRIGWPGYSTNGGITVDTDRPVTFGLLSFTRFENAVLTQINYIVWFPSRPKHRFWDIYGGLLDGLNYRVTLDSTGEPLLYETIHNCGCYYKAYPTGRLHPRPSIAYDEPPLILAAPQPTGHPTRMVVAMDSGTHYVRHLYPYSGTPSGDATYALAEYDELKRLPLASGSRRSLFDRYGIATGSQRLERFILWPMGVYSPGAMRQWGRHAVAFVGRRHFDDPFYLQEMFETSSRLSRSAAPVVRPAPGSGHGGAVGTFAPSLHPPETEPGKP